MLTIPKGTQNEMAVLVYAPNYELMFKFAEGSGDNILPDDLRDGYNDYVGYNVSKHTGDAVFEGIDGKIHLYNNTCVRQWTDMIGPAIMHYLQAREPIELVYLGGVQ